MSKNKVLYEEVGYKDSIRAANNSVRSSREWVYPYKKGGTVTLIPKEKKGVYSPTLEL